MESKFVLGFGILFFCMPGHCTKGVLFACQCTSDFVHHEIDSLLLISNRMMSSSGFPMLHFASSG